MAKQLINLGSVVNDKTGDTLRVGAQKINSNFTELYSALTNTAGQLNVVSSITALDGISVGGTITNVIISSKVASYTDLGAVKVGDSLSVTGNGTLDYILPEATESVLGGVKIDGTTITKNQDGIISAAAAITPSQIENGLYFLSINSDGLVTISPSISGKSALKTLTELELIVNQASWNFSSSGVLTLPDSGDIVDSDGNSVLGAFALQVASPTELGGIKVGSGLTIVDGVLSVISQAYTLPAATSNALGGVIIPGTLTSGIINTNGTIGLATASDTQLGAVKVDDDSIVINNGVISVNNVKVTAVESRNYFLDLAHPNFGYTQGHWLQLQAQEITSTFSLGAIAQWITFKGNVGSLDAKRIVIAPDVLDGWTMELGGPTVNQTGLIPVGDTYISKSYITNMYGTNISITGDTNLGSVSNVTITGGTSGQVLTTDGSGNLSWTTITGSGSASSLNDLTDVTISSATPGQALIYNGTLWTNTTLQGGTGGFDQNLNTTDSVEFASVTADSFISTATGVPTLSSATNINLTAANAVVVTASPFRLASLTTTERNELTAVNGDMIYNLTTNKIQGYQSGAWINLDGTV